MAQDTWGQALQNAAAGPQPLPPATYDFRVKSGKHQKASSGRDMIVVVLEVVSGPLAGRTAYNNFVLQPDREVSMGYFFHDMEALGLPREWFAQALGNSPIDAQTCSYIASQLTGRYVTADVSLQANDSTRNDIKGFKPMQGGPAAPAPGSAPAPAFPQPGVPQVSGFPQPAGLQAPPAPAAPQFQPPAPQPQFAPPPAYQPAQQPQPAPAAQDPWVTAPSAADQPPQFPPAQGFPQPGGFPQAPAPGPAPQAPGGFDPSRPYPYPGEAPGQQPPAAPAAQPAAGAPVPQPPAVTF